MRNEIYKGIPHKTLEKILQTTTKRMVTTGERSGAIWNIVDYNDVRIKGTLRRNPKKIIK